MENLLVKIRESYRDLGKNDRSIAGFILQNENEVLRLTISKIAAGSNTSQAAVVRFCKLFGSKGYKDFRSRLASDILEQAQKPELPSEYFTTDLSGNETVLTIVERMTNNNMRSIRETKDLLDETTLEKAVNALAEALRIDFFGSGASGIVALDAHQKFIRIGKICNVAQDSHIQMTLASSLRPNDAAVVISYSGKTKDALEIATAAKERHAVVIAITKCGNGNPLADLADIVLYTTAPEAVYRSGATSSRIAQLTIIDILFAGTASRNIEAYYENLESTYKYAAIKKMP